MQSIHPVRLLSAILACVLFSSAMAQDESRTQRPACASAADEAALHAFAGEVYAAYTKKDLDSYVRLWSAKAPELAARRKALDEFFAGHEKIELKGLAIRKMAVEGEKAKLRVDVEINATDVKTDKPATDLGKMVRVLEAVREEGIWKVWREAPGEVDLAETLFSLKTDAERSALLTAEPELVTGRLVQEMNQRGTRLSSQGDYPGALVWFLLAQNIAEQIGDKAAIASALSNIGSIHYLQGNYALALGELQKSLALSEATGSKTRIATIVRIGTVHFSQGNYALALEHYQMSLALSEALGDKDGIARSLSSIGAVQYRQGNYAQALEHYQKGLAMCEALGDKLGIVSALLGIGNLHHSQGNYAQALENYEKCLALSDAWGVKIGSDRALTGIGNVHSNQGNYAQALEHFQKSLALSEALGDKTGMIGALNSIGTVHRLQGNYARALKNLQKSLALSEALGNKDGIAATLGKIGIVYYSQGNYARALESYQRSLTLSEALGDKAEIARALGNIGVVHYMQGNYAQALEHYQKNLTLNEILGDRNGIASSLINMGAAHSSQGDSAQALEDLQKGLALEEALGDKAGIALTLSDIGNVYTLQGNYSRALEQYQKSLSLSEPLGNRAAISYTLIYMANASRLHGNYVGALDFAGRATILAEQFSYPDQFWSSRTVAGQSYRALNQLAPAREAFEQAIAAIETLRTKVAGGEQEQQHFFEDKLDPYQAMVDLLVAQNESGAALAYAERAKARVLLDVLHSGRVNVTKAMTRRSRSRNEDSTIIWFRSTRRFRARISARSPIPPASAISKPNCRKRGWITRHSRPTFTPRILN